MEHYHNDINMNICRDGKMDHSCSMGWEKMNYSYSNFSFTQELMAPCSHPKVYEHGLFCSQSPCDWIPAIPEIPSVSGAQQKKMDRDMAAMARKRKCSSIDSLDICDDDEDGGDNDDSVKKFARQNHSEIEKRRRDKMNTYIIQLSNMLPMCNAMNRKLDKLTVLRMAVQHMKSLRGSATTYTEASHKPSFLSDDELKHLILEAADGFLFVVGCDRARILFVSESVQNVLRHSRNELMGQSLFDYIHPRDISKVKEQFSSSDLSPRERLIDAKTLMPVKTELPQRPTHLCSGARRSFYCRMKCRSDSSLDSLNCNLKLEKEGDVEFCGRKRKSDQKSYTVIHFTGYLKSWPTSKINISDSDDLEDNCNLSCLVAIGQLRTNLNQMSTSSASISGLDVRPLEYMLRITVDGKLSFIDQAATIVLGYLPQELLGTSVYEYYHQDDITHLADIHRKVLNCKEKIQTGVYRFKSKCGSFLHVRSTCFSFRNPWTKDVEYIVSTNTVVPMDEVTSSGCGYESAGVLSLDTDCSTTADDLDGCKSTDKLYVPGLPEGIRPGAGRIGRQIADEMVELTRGSRSPNIVDSTNTDSFDNQRSSKAHNPLLNCSAQAATGVAPPFNPLISTVNTQVVHTPTNGISVTVPGVSAQNVDSVNLLETAIEEQAMEEIVNPGGTADGDEAAMSMIMSLLEADAGLGGPIDFNDLPWPL